jgi:hypothetical protein
LTADATVIHYQLRGDITSVDPAISSINIGDQWFASIFIASETPDTGPASGSRGEYVNASWGSLMVGDDTSNWGGNENIVSVLDADSDGVFPDWLKINMNNYYQSRNFSLGGNCISMVRTDLLALPADVFSSKALLETVGLTIDDFDYSGGRTLMLDLWTPKGKPVNRSQVVPVLGSINSFSATTGPVPVPASARLFESALGLLDWVRRRKR